jgi:hypothetical protein
LEAEPHLLKYNSILARYSFLIKVQLYFFNLDAWGVEQILLEFSAELESFHTNRNFRAEEPGNA